MVLPSCRAVIFDLDGTLVDSMPLVLRAFAHALEPYRPDLTAENIFSRLGGPPLRTFLELTGNEAHAADAMQRLETFGFANSHLEQPFPGMKAMLTRLRDQGLTLAIWTGRDRFTTEIILREHDLAGFFATVVCGDDLDTHKPHPGGLKVILQRLNMRPEQALYAGDADADVLGGAGAGVPTLLIRHRRIVDTAIAAQAWHVVADTDAAYAAVLTAVGAVKSFPSAKV
jgi:HAD superfamily hydrolase (TIGR01509 family)